MLKRVFINQVYRNKKNKECYFVASIGLHTELLEATVHYKPLYNATHSDYYRPLELFKEKFEEAPDYGKA